MTAVSRDERPPDADRQIQQWRKNSLVATKSFAFCHCPAAVPLLPTRDFFTRI